MRKGVTGKAGHYTQIVWAETHKIGCGYIMYRKGKRYNKVYNLMVISFNGFHIIMYVPEIILSKDHNLLHFQVLVCNYGPGGNEAGGSMYKIGKPGSLCSNGSEKGLCL